jgi:3-hydroxyisobutyrate dehydrogenase-like beta-hydroxyacid dehydrogenase
MHMTISKPKRQIAVAGLGNMGSAVAEALLTAKHNVVAWNRTAGKSASVSKMGASIAPSPAAAVEGSDVLVISLLGYEATMAVLASEGIDAALKDKTVIQLSTMSASQSRDLDDWLRRRGALYLDGSFLGYPDDVRKASCSILISGPRAIFDANRDIFEAMGNALTFVGETPGLALVADKLVYAQFYGIAYACMHTAAMAAAAGVSIGTLREISGGTDLWQWKGRTMDDFLRRVERQSYDNADATMEVHAAAFDHVLRMSREFDVEPAYSQLIADTLARSMETGHTNHELAAIFEVLVAGRITGRIK